VGSADFFQTANGLSAGGHFSVSPSSGNFSFAPTSSLNLSGKFNLHDGDLQDGAAITRIQFDLTTVPETPSLVLLASGMVLILSFRLHFERRYRRHQRS
jgi:hypothetical protein